MTAWLLVLGGIYLALLVYATFHARRRTRSADDYVLAGSNLGPVLGFLTYAATLFSTFTLLGMPDFVRQQGVGGWIFLGVSNATAAFIILWFGFHLRRRASTRRFRGMAGLLSDCYGTRWAGYLYFAGVFVFLIPYVAIQFRGVGIFFNAAYPDTLPVWGWTTIIVVVMLIYSELGGLKAIIYSDARQGVLLLAASWVIAFMCLRWSGSPAELFQSVRIENEALLSTPGPHNLFTPQFLIASFLAITLLPVTQPQLTTRIVIMRSSKAIRHMAASLSVLAMFAVLPSVIIGMYGAVNYADASTSDFLAQVLFFDQAPVIAVAVTVGLMAAAMSTADSQIFALGAELRSLLGGDERVVLAFTKLAIAGFALAALTFAILSSDELVLLARVSFAGTALLAPLIMAAMLSSRPLSARIIVATGITLSVFLLSLAGLIPDTVGSLRMDLALLLAIAGFTAIEAATARGQAL